jgi:Lipase (class 3)
VYTFGCPRVGNASFSAAYDKLVPETWHVINDRDTVGSCTRGPIPTCGMYAVHFGILSLTRFMHHVNHALCNEDMQYVQITQVGKFRVNASDST